ncbi:hypothetical protein IWQ60_000011 [Tieghemiomyces parasiticus]|uniref:Uncharacterized protein n=1 Tax=Tieghemiomyces parasiticus TaxID=78921 RepID=A0A9W8E351_9FUNG|nr:hypothetical protein IWQ60_000011 [Tieghemiomyces parasiticus]
MQRQILTAPHGEPTKIVDSKRANRLHRKANNSNSQLAPRQAPSHIPELPTARAHRVASPVPCQPIRPHLVSPKPTVPVPQGRIRRLPRAAQRPIQVLRGLGHRTPRGLPAKPSPARKVSQSRLFLHQARL